MNHLDYMIEMFSKEGFSFKVFRGSVSPYYYSKKQKAVLRIPEDEELTKEDLVDLVNSGLTVFVRKGKGGEALSFTLKQNEEDDHYYQVVFSRPLTKEEILRLEEEAKDLPY